MARLALRLLAEAEACPELISRSETPSGLTKPPASGPFPAMALLSDPALDARRYLEDLVRIAIDSARQAEDMSSEAREASRKARRGMAVLVGFGALGLMVGIAGFAASRSANVRLSEVGDEVSALQNMQQPAQDRLADIAARRSDQRDAFETTSQPSVAPAAVVAQSSPARVPKPPSFRYHLWPDSRPSPPPLHW